MSYIYQVYDPLKFHRIGAQLGIPTDPQTGQIPPQQVKYLEEDYSRVRDVLESTRNALASSPNSPPSDLIAPRPLPGTSLQQIPSGEIDFGTVFQDMIPNLPFKTGMYLSDLP